MNITTTTQSQTELNKPNINQIENDSMIKSEKTSSAKNDKKANEKSTEEKSDFQTMLEEQKNVEEVKTEQPEQQNVNVNQNQQINEQYINKFGFDVTSEIQKIKTTYNFDTISISKDDAKFFADLVENKDFALLQGADTANLVKFSDEIGPTYKTLQTSQVLTDLISKAYNEQKPVRIDFDNKVSVILKVDSKGGVTADFIPGDKAVEAYLRNNIGYLKQRFDDQNLEYNVILYRQSNQQNKSERRQNQQKDKG